MNTFTITWDKVANGDFPKDKLENIVDDISITVYPTSISKQTVHFYCKEGEKLSGEDIFSLGMLVHSIIINK